jgi:hypothetical protein
MTDDTILPFSFPAVHVKKVTAAFDGGRLTSNGGVMLLAMAERRLGLADKLARSFPDRRDPTRVVHSLVDMFRARMFGPIRRSSWPVVGCRTRARICVPNRRCRGWRMRPACAT